MWIDIKEKCDIIAIASAIAFLFGEIMKTLIVLISGKMRSGKNTLADNLIDVISAKTNSELKIGHQFFAKPVKDQCKDVYLKLTEYLNIISEQYNIPELYTVEDNWYEDKNTITRILLQTYATDIFRDRVDEDYWVNNLLKTVLTSNMNIVFVTDWRFKNEVEVLKNSAKHFPNDIELLTVRINRPSIDRSRTEHEHQSEIDLDDYQLFDVVIENTDIDSLFNSSKELADKIIELVS